MLPARDRKQIEGEEGADLSLRSLPARASFPSRGCCCWEEGREQGPGWFCTLMQTALGPFLWPVLAPNSQGGALFLTRKVLGLLPFSWAVLGFSLPQGACLE